MRKNKLFWALLLQAIVFQAISQNSINQIVLGNGGIYGNSSDHVMITGIAPSDYSSTYLGEVVRESIQDLIVVEDIAYVAAEDSLVKFDLLTGQKLAAIYQGNLSRLYFHDQILYVSLRSDLSGPPADGIYLKSFDENLAFLQQADGISTDGAGICVVEDTIYVAVPGDWQATEGHLAIVSLDFSNVRELNLGTDAVGINDLIADENQIYTVNKSPYLATTGSITTYNTISTNFATHVFNHVVGKVVKKAGELLYLGIDYGIGSYNLSTGLVIESQIIPDPGSSSYINIASAVFDEINQQFYVAITDYFSFGEGSVYDIEGNMIGNFDASVSAEAMAIHYNLGSATYELSDNVSYLYPNPCANQLYIRSIPGNLKTQLLNSTGQVLQEYDGNFVKSLNLETYPSGIYFVRIEKLNEVILEKLIKL